MWHAGLPTLAALNSNRRLSSTAILLLSHTPVPVNTHTPIHMPTVTVCVAVCVGEGTRMTRLWHRSGILIPLLSHTPVPLKQVHKAGYTQRRAVAPHQRLTN